MRIPVAVFFASVWRDDPRVAAGVPLLRQDSSREGLRRVRNHARRSVSESGRVASDLLQTVDPGVGPVVKISVLFVALPPESKNDRLRTTRSFLANFRVVSLSPSHGISYRQIVRRVKVVVVTSQLPSLSGCG